MLGSKVSLFSSLPQVPAKGCVCARQCPHLPHTSTKRLGWTVGGAQRSRLHRGSVCVSAKSDDKGVGSRDGGLWGWLKKSVSSLEEIAKDEDPASPSIAFITDDNTAWKVQLALYERSPTTPLSQKEASKLNLVEVGFTCRFDKPDAGYFPLRGAAEVEDSRFFRGGKGAFWINDEPGFFKFTLNVEPVQVGGVEVLPAGRVFFNAKLKEGNLVEGAPYALESGVATIKQDVKASFMGADYSGILAEYIVVGQFKAQPATSAESD
uniref:Uncharacterized protein n=1 Tax=Pyramimonas obovata TaxID=1411642 RepID=A0A7S0REV2_9CHLO|mmetsp:Transcript_32433/g.70823  ORF Transcript_32433/g.70823 Transcript_32433/m.70823 type:complete len:265 (+) Transcript_32433:56-850(+)